MRHENDWTSGRSYRYCSIFPFAKPGGCLATNGYLLIADTRWLAVKLLLIEHENVITCHSNLPTDSPALYIM